LPRSSLLPYSTLFRSLLASTVGGFAGLTYLTKFSFLEELGKQYVLTARAKGLGERQVLYGHVFRNAMLIIIAGIPAAIVGIFFRSEEHTSELQSRFDL